MRISIFEVEDWERNWFQGLSEDHEVCLTSAPLTRDSVQEHTGADVISTFIYSELGGEVLRRFEHLKLIATRSTGYDHIDLGFCRERRVIVSNVPTYGSNTVAEHVFGLLLTISHRLEEAIDRTRKGDFSPRGLQGFDLSGKNFGVIGTGEIGRSAIRIARGFDMEVLAFDVRPDEEAARKLGFSYVELDELLARADVISLHVPSSPATHHMISRREFEKMKEGAVLINTSRGNVVDIQALVRALAEKKLAGAGLDVLPEEPVIREEAELLRSVYEEKHDLRTLLANHLVSHMRNVVVTPHSAFNTREAVSRILETTVENIKGFTDGKPRNVVDLG